MPRKKLYYTKDSIEKPRVARSGEFILQDTLKPYVGIYVVANGQYMTGTEPSETSQILTPVISKFTEEKTSKYFELTGLEFNKHIAPNLYHPNPTAEDYKIGQFQRFFVQKINELFKIYEIDDKQFKTINKNNEEGIDGNLYNKFEIQWMLKGPDSKKINQKNIDFANLKYQGIAKVLSNISQFILE